MKKLITPLLLLVSLPTFSQCTFMLPMAPGYTKITTDQTVTSTGALYWICDGVQVTVASSLGSTFVLEEYASITFLDSDGDQVYAKDNCVVTNTSAGDVGVVMNPSTVTISNTGSGSIFTSVSCTAVTYDYMLVGGSSGCAPFTSISEAEKQTIDVYPNPAQSQLVIQGAGQQTYTLFSLLGEVVMQGTLSDKTELNCGSLQRGVYFIQVGKQTFKVLLQ